jgi:hypothetical protein
VDVKIYTPPEAVRFMSTTDRDAQGGTYQQDRREKQRQAKGYSTAQKTADPEIIQVTDERLDLAVLAFQKDNQAKGQGIAAEKAPGLKVVLKDGSGSVIRLFSGEEFIKMHEAIQDGRISGKIIDQKA